MESVIGPLMFWRDFSRGMGFPSVVGEMRNTRSQNLRTFLKSCDKRDDMIFQICYRARRGPRLFPRWTIKKKSLHYTITMKMKTTMPASKPQKRSGRRQPLGLVSANISFLPSNNNKKRSSAAKAGDDAARAGAGAGGEGGDDDGGSVSSTVSSRFSYRGIKNNLLLSTKKKRRGLLSSMVVAGGRKIGGRRAGGSSSSAAASDALGGGDAADHPCVDDAFAYEDFDNFLVGRCVAGHSHTIDEMRSLEDDGSHARHPQKSNRPATPEVVDTEGRAVRYHPRVISCDMPASITSPSWSEYGSAMMENWGVLEKAANFVDSPDRDDAPEEETGEGCAGCAVVVESDDPPRAARAGPERGDVVPTSVGAEDDGPVGVAVARRHREADDDRSRPRSSLLPGDLADDDAERGSVPTTSSDDDYFAFQKEDAVSCAVPPHKSGITASSYPASDDTRAGAPLSVEIGRDWELEGVVPPRGNGELGPAPLDIGGYVDIDDDLESGNTTTTGYVAMADDDVLAGSDIAIRRCSEPSAGDVVISPRSPAAMAMAFGSLVFLTHLIWVASTKH